jgi:predicted RNA-binding protein with RPS1 domain
LTEEQQGGTAPAVEATPSETDPAPEQSAAAVAVADEPAATTDATPEATAPIDTHGVTPDVPDAPAADDAAGGPAAEATGSIQTAPADDTAAVDAPAPGQPAAEPDVAQPSDGAAAVDETDFADAPAASEPDEEPEPAPRDLGPEPTTMEELLAEQSEDIKSFKHGDVVEGNVVRIDKDEILVDIGAKSEGVVSNRELFGRHGENQPQLAIGDTVLVYVLQPESPEGHAVLSLRRAGLERKWRSMQEQFEAGLIIEAPVIDHNKGGLIVDCGIRGFVPISQIVDFPRRPQNDQPATPPRRSPRSSSRSSAGSFASRSSRSTARPTA